MSKDRRSHDQKRKAKLAMRSKKEASNDPLPYSGTKYRADRWAPHVYRTELPIYETIQFSRRRLTNAQVREALVHLIHHLRRGEPALLPADTPEVPFVTGNEVEFLVWNIRQHWRTLVAEQGPVSSQDLVGIMRTLLYSLEAHAWNRGPDRGYVDFLVDFMQGRV